GDRVAAQGHAVHWLNAAEANGGRTAALGVYFTRPADFADAVGPIAFATGSIAATFASFDARTFNQPPDGWRPTLSSNKKAWFEGSGAPLIGDLIRRGITGVAGQVAEPYVAGAIRPQILFPAYFAGFNLAEAFYLSMPALSWQTVVIGDPLTAAVPRNPFGRAQAEGPTDQSTELPGLFAKRRLAVLRAENPGVPE